MSKEKLKGYSIEQLKKREKNLKGIIWIFVPLIIGLFYFVIRDYFSEEGVDWSVLTIAICTLGGPATIYPELKNVREEIRSRN